LAFGRKSGFKNKCQSRAGFELQNEAQLQLWSLYLLLGRPLGRFILGKLQHAGLATPIAY